MSILGGFAYIEVAPAGFAEILLTYEVRVLIA